MGTLLRGSNMVMIVLMLSATPWRPAPSSTALPVLWGSLCNDNTWFQNACRARFWLVTCKCWTFSIIMLLTHGVHAKWPLTMPLMIEKILTHGRGHTTMVAGMSLMSALGATSLKGTDSLPRPGVVGAMPISAGPKCTSVHTHV